MNTETRGQIPNFLSLTGVPLLDAATAYTRDAWQRSVLYADVMRQRGNQYQQHLAEEVPNVLNFPAELVMSGMDLPRPVNYAMVRIWPKTDIPQEPGKRPFVVIDPRAGHGPGIGGFKPDSEIGAALSAGHPCYFVGFLPNPVPGQTVEDVIRAELAFLEKVIALHPDSEGKPAVIGNCQAGWQILMAAAMRPELFGPIIVAGTPLSYWAGWEGHHPMRYAGGLLGGSWMTALAGDIGNGHFDGATLVQNFENLNPSNTLWYKQYNLYAKVDTEAARFLGFEKYWGGHVFLNAVEMQYIVDELFVGNRLSSCEMITSDGIRLDLRNIRSPIVVFCSYGDNITPPPQALGWITDLYQDDADLLAHDQTIVYATHDSIGHLGIFVSGAVGRKEHQKFATNIDMIDLLPSGIYQAVITDKTETTAHADLIQGNYLMSLEMRNLNAVRDIVQPKPESDRRFATVAHISDINLGLYRHFIQPWVQSMVTPYSAHWSQVLHPLRVGFELWSDRHPLAATIAQQASQVRENRQPVDTDNPFLVLQEMYSDAIGKSLDSFRDQRDALYEWTFNFIYSQPWVQAIAGLSAEPMQPARPHPGMSPEHRQFVIEQARQLHTSIGEGGAVEAGIRAFSYILHDRQRIDERHYLLSEKFHAGHRISLAVFQQILRRQINLLRLARDASLAAIPQLLARSTADEVRQIAQTITNVLESSDPLTEQEQDSLQQVQKAFENAAQWLDTKKQPGEKASATHLKTVKMAKPALKKERSLGSKNGRNAPRKPTGRRKA